MNLFSTESELLTLRYFKAFTGFVEKLFYCSDRTKMEVIYARRVTHLNKSLTYIAGFWLRGGKKPALRSNVKKN
jgi:hypothetical protein